ncbi:eukaryotic translation initiation factor 3 subunit A [Canna indica]|uniref:Eukaryotic translation initiation factor 3 subunit A n=1 Tax=Canna indica TaxID=4628 RepID=A0AAQ3QFR2_9LILI|nr:eukaryotic translation initiation factor 3 subunit A [Canna indica]
MSACPKNSTVKSGVEGSTSFPLLLLQETHLKDSKALEFVYSMGKTWKGAAFSSIGASGGLLLSRSSLISELTNKGVMTCVSQEVKDIFNLLENEFLPLDLASRVQPLLAKISKLSGKLSSASSVLEVQLAKYVPALEKLTTLRVL